MLVKFAHTLKQMHKMTTNELKMRICEWKKDRRQWQWQHVDSTKRVRAVGKKFWSPLKFDGNVCDKKQ